MTLDNAESQPELRTAASVEIDKSGLLIDGERFPYFIGEEVEVDHLSDSVAKVSFSVFTENFTIAGNPPRRATLTQHFN